MWRKMSRLTLTDNTKRELACRRERAGYSKYSAWPV